MTTAAVIRAYAPADRDAVLAVWDASVRLAHPFWGPEELAGERVAVRDVFLPSAETWVAERDGVVVGFISLLGDEVGGLFVAPTAHRQGIARALMDHARASRRSLELDVFEDNTLGRVFYDGYGMRVVATRMDQGRGRRVLRMRTRADHRSLALAVGLLAALMGGAFLAAPRSCAWGLQAYTVAGACAVLALAVLPFVAGPPVFRSRVGSAVFGVALGMAVWVAGLVLADFQLLCRLF